jgi:hypothetical protein
MKGIRFFLVLVLITGGLITFIAVRLRAADDTRATKSASENAARIGIERLHQQDVEATLSDKADELAKLWDSEAVRIQHGRAAEVGKVEICASDKRWEAKPDRPRTLCYKSEIKDIQIAGDWAFEWGLRVLQGLQQSQADARQSAESDEATAGRLLEIRARDCFQ